MFARYWSPVGKVTQSFSGKAMPALAVVGAPLLLSGVYVARRSSDAAAKRPEIKRFLLTAGWRNNIELFVRDVPKLICVNPANVPLNSAGSIVPRCSKNAPACWPEGDPLNVTTAASAVTASGAGGVREPSKRAAEQRRIDCAQVLEERAGLLAGERPAERHDRIVERERVRSRVVRTEVHGPALARSEEPTS